MVDLLFSVFASLIANVISVVYGVEKKTRGKASFENRSQRFHSDISPYLLEKVLPERVPKTSKKLEKIETPEGRKTLPYINLIKGEGLSLGRHLATDIRKKHHDSSLLSWLTKELGKKVTNNPTFTIQSISSTGEISAGISDYFSTLSTCDKHYLDLIRYFPDQEKIGSFFAYRHKKQTTAWLESLSKIVTRNSFRHYHASIGCSVFTVMKSSDGRYKYPIKLNAKEKGSGVSDRHVLPSFMLQPISNSHVLEQQRELDFTINVLREYGEELLGVPELETAETADVMFDYISNNPLLHRLHKQLQNGEAKLVVTGLVLDVFRLRPEVTFLLILNDDIYSKKLKTNWETEERSLEMFELHDTSAYWNLVCDSHEPLCAPGLAALINGRQRAIEYLQSDAGIIIKKV